jgi:hypothetical protein
VDFWLLVGRLVRRWYLTVPLFVVVGFVAGGVSSAVQSSYAIETQVLLAPAGAPDEAAGNPLLQATRNQLDAATQAVVLVLDSPAASTERDGAVPGADVTFTPIEEAPIILVSGSAADPASVEDAVAFGVDQLEDALRSIQEPLGTEPVDEIEVVPLATPTVVEEAGDQRRVLIGTLVGGILGAGLLVLAVDQLLRRRLERKLTADLDTEVGRLTNGVAGAGARHHAGG